MDARSDYPGDIHWVALIFVIQFVPFTSPPIDFGGGVSCSPLTRMWDWPTVHQQLLRYLP